MFACTCNPALLVTVFLALLALSTPAFSQNSSQDDLPDAPVPQIKITTMQTESSEVFTFRTQDLQLSSPYVSPGVSPDRKPECSKKFLGFIPCNSVKGVAPKAMVFVGIVYGARYLYDKSRSGVRKVTDH